MPLIIRIDGCHFHTFTKHLEKPFDDILMKSMQQTALYLCKNIMGAKLAYTQSDEISILVTDYDTLTVEPWFGKNLQKLCSVAASMATMKFNQEFKIGADAWLREYNNEFIHNATLKKKHDYLPYLLGTAYFDARAFVLPKEEVTNYFIWRMNDCVRNSIEMVGRAHFSHKELFKKSCAQIQDMLHEKEINWNYFPTIQKRGTCVIKEIQPNSFMFGPDGEVLQDLSKVWFIDTEIPVFTQDRNYVEKWVEISPENS